MVVDDTPLHHRSLNGDEFTVGCVHSSRVPCHACNTRWAATDHFLTAVLSRQHSSAPSTTCMFCSEHRTLFEGTLHRPYVYRHHRQWLMPLVHAGTQRLPSSSPARTARAAGRPPSSTFPVEGSTPGTVCLSCAQFKRRWRLPARHSMSPFRRPHPLAPPCSTPPASSPSCTRC